MDLFSYLFGNILAIGPEELYISIALSLVVLAVIFLYFNEIFSMTSTRSSPACRASARRGSTRYWPS